MSIGGIFMINPFSSEDFTACAASAAWVFSALLLKNHSRSESRKFQFRNVTHSLGNVTHTVFLVIVHYMKVRSDKNTTRKSKTVHGRVRTKGIIHAFAMICANPVYRITGSWEKRNLSIIDGVTKM